MIEPNSLEHHPMTAVALTSQLEFEVISPARAPDEIAAQIRDMVAKGRLKPGDRLPSERDLSQRLHVSRNTLREALRALEHAGIVEMRKGAHGGAFVLHGNSNVIVTGMRDLYHLGAITPQQLTDARIWLSEITVRIACEKATEEELRALEANIEATAKADKLGQFDERQKLNREFHLVLARVTCNPIIESTMEGVMEVMGEFIKRIGPSENPFILPSRRRLLKFLRARDTESAVKEMTKLLVRLQVHYLALWSEHKAAGR